MKPLDTVVADDDILFDDGADPEALLLEFSDDDWAVELDRVLLAPESTNPTGHPQPGKKAA